MRTTLAAAATILLGVARRWVESRRTRQGHLVPVGPDTQTVPARQGPAAEWIAGWVPRAPATPVGRALAATWAAPLTTVGGLLARAGGARASWDPERGCWVATGVRGPSAVLLGALGLDANAIGHMVLVRTPAASTRLLDHEVVHVRQAERLGPGLPVLYALFSARYGYRENPLERAARLGAARTERP